MKTWKNLTELRKIAKEAGVKAVHKKDQATLLEELTQAGVEVSETPGADQKAPAKAPEPDKAETVTKAEPKAETASNEKADSEGAENADKEKTDDKQAESGPEASDPEAGRERSDELGDCERRIAELSKELDYQRKRQSELIAEAAKVNQPKTFIELLNEQKELNKASKAVANAAELRRMGRAMNRPTLQPPAVK